MGTEILEVRKGENNEFYPEDNMYRLFETFL